jgi:hypothetical protein
VGRNWRLSLPFFPVCLDVLDRPDTTNVHTIGPYWRTVGGNFTSLPEHFKNNGLVDNSLFVAAGQIFFRFLGHDCWTAKHFYWRPPMHALTHHFAAHTAKWSRFRSFRPTVRCGAS